VLSSTNLIENLLSRMRDTARRLKRGRRHDDPEMDRGGMLEAETSFPQSRRLSSDTEAGRSTSRSRFATRCLDR
jgi:hypothetical protein